LWEKSACVISDFRSSFFDVPIFWDIARRKLVVVYRILGSVFPSHLQGYETSTAYRLPP